MLIAAGQLESALADRNSPLTPFAGSVTDALARACVDSNPLDISSLRLSLETLAHDSENALQISDPEGFSYYSLHPLDFADAMTSYRGDAHVGVVGIRSIGTTLSAVAVAALRALGVRASRITVRPSGHPYDRRNDFTQIQKLWVEEQTRSNAKILIVDEGPGLSGSSFLSVAESLVRQGVLADQITILGTHVVGPENLCTPHSTERWQQYRSCTVGSRVAAEHALLHSISGGSWRQTFLYQEGDWPASWTEMESSKFISPDPRHFFKFEGLGPAGAEVRRRAIKLSDAGFTPLYEDSHEGVTKYELVAGRPLCVSDLSHEVLDRIVDYCSFRANAFQAANCGTKELERMLAFNYSQETGSELDFRNLNLACLQPVIPDNRMQPHKWIQRQDGRILKVDANRHGDDHFWPGPTDILWDLAGAVVEWDMTRAATDYLMHRFHKQTGRDASEQTTSFALAYSCFRMAYSKMAMHSVADEHEKARFWRAHKFYHHRMMAAAAQAQAC